MEKNILLNIFCDIAGIDEKDAEKWKWLLENAWENIMAMLKEDADIEKNKQRIYSAVAAWAAEDFFEIKNSGGDEEIKIGSVALKNSRGGLISIKDKFIADIADIIKPASPVIFWAGDKNKV